ncbi:hypothetical protein [Brevundimonas sp.]|uniref:hypothetical protein n=1 Tax=Brevundimonas sp. TaxID=1871086 RepID=UPI00289D0C9B|nr:hypothetical protein [Brevundimonas sp.]
MKKFASLFAGVAAVALTAGAASADPIYQGSVTGVLGTYAGDINGSGFGNAFGLGAVIGADIANNWVGLNNTSLIVISGGSAGNNGQESNTDGATFTLKGNVTKDCAYYTGNANTTIDFGTIGIYASNNAGPAAAFDMTAPASVSIDTNLAGCNTSNTVSVSKNDIRGLVNNSGVGYDSNVFQAHLPYSVTGSYTAGAVGSTSATAGNWINLAEGANATSATHGAWKSAMSLDVNIPVPSKSLLAGNYEGKLTVSITAF